MEQSDPVNLSTMPNEILTHIFMYLPSKDLLNVSHVCKSFAANAETAFAQTYSKNNWHILSDRFLRDYPNRYPSLKSYKVIISKYGRHLANITVTHISNENVWLLDLIEEKCVNLKIVDMGFVPKLIDLRGLRKIRLNDFRGISMEHFIAFIEKNPNLEKVELLSMPSGLIETLHNRLPKLKYLKVDVRSIDFSVNIPKITLQSLKSLEIVFTFTQEHFDRVLHVMDCPNVTHLDMASCEQLNDDLISEITKFKVLTSLQLINCFITTNEMRKLSDNLPKLTTFEIGITKSKSFAEAESKIFTVLSIFSSLTKLTAHLEDFFLFFGVFKKQPMENFQARFTQRFPNAEVEIIGPDDDIICTSKDRVYMYTSSPYSCELHWIDNFSEQNVRNTLKKISNALNVNFKDINNCLKFVNHCTDNLDISALSTLKCIECLDIKSKGPISVNTIVSMDIIFDD